MECLASNVTQVVVCRGFFQKQGDGCDGLRTWVGWTILCKFCVNRLCICRQKYGPICFITCISVLFNSWFSVAGRIYISVARPPFLLAWQLLQWLGPARLLAVCQDKLGSLAFCRGSKLPYFKESCTVCIVRLPLSCTKKCRGEKKRHLFIN